MKSGMLALGLLALAGAAQAQVVERETVVRRETIIHPGHPAPWLDDAPRSPAFLSPDGDVIVTGSVGLPSPRPLPPAQVCAVAHATCPAPYGAPPGLICTCYVPMIGVETGLTR